MPPDRIALAAWRMSTGDDADGDEQTGQPQCDLCSCCISRLTELRGKVREAIVRKVGVCGCVNLWNPIERARERVERRREEEAERTVSVRIARRQTERGSSCAGDPAGNLEPEPPLSTGAPTFLVPTVRGVRS